MPPGTSGLERDLHLVRRRAWLFIPFLILGIVVALLFGSFAGKANAVATLQLDTVIQDVVSGGDRGLRIFEAQSMTQDDRFRAAVVAASGDPQLDYSRYVISLIPISIGDGVSRGTLTVSIKDGNKATAEKLRQVFVDVYIREYTSLDGLFRKRFIEKKQEVVDEAERRFQEAYKKLKPLADAQHVPLDSLVRIHGSADAGPAVEFDKQEAALRGELALVTAALATPATATSGVQASALLGVMVADGAAAQAALQARQAILASAIDQLAGRRAAISDGAFDPGFLAQLDGVRALADVKEQSYVRLEAAHVAVTSAQSTLETSYSASGGVSGTTMGRVAIVLAVTIVFGLIAIYLVEWLSQVRAKHEL